MKTPLPLLTSLAAVASWISLALSGPVLVERAAEALDLNAVAEHYLPVRIVQAAPGEERSRLIAALHRADGRANAPAVPGTNLRNADDIYYAIDVQVGKQTVTLHLDTGSSDTWMVQSPLQCYNSWDMRVPEEQCGFGRRFEGSFSQGVVPNRVFERRYDDRTFVIGYYGFEDVTIGGLTAKHQQLAMANVSHWRGDNTTSGLLGLAYPFMTEPGNQTGQYDPIFTSLWKQNLTRPMFSVALSRHETDPKKQAASYLAFGGVPPTVDFDGSSWSRTPIQPLREIGSWSFLDSKDQGLYVIRPEAYVYGAEGTTPVVNTTELFSFIIDIGAESTYLPLELARIIMAKFDPPAEYSRDGGAWYTACDAKVPRVGLQIGSQVFYMDPADLLRQNRRDDWANNTQCRVGIMDAYVPPYILGIPFLSSVVAVFDVGNTEMRFAARSHY